MSHRATLRLQDRYCRSVDLVRDFDRNDRLAGYIVTPAAAEALRRILRGVSADSTNRAWSLVGPYGAGKSAFALLTAAAVDGRPGGGLPEELREALRQRLPEADALLPGTAGGAPLLPVLIVGDRQMSLAEKILSALLAAAEPVWPGRRAGVFKELVSMEARVRKGEAEPTAQEVVDVVLGVARRLRREGEGPQGVLLMVDEFGKHLERSVLRKATDDAFLLQGLAEAAARSGGAPLVVVTIQHQNVEAYAAGASESVLNEWRKVQGRYEQINYQESAEQLLVLLAHAIEREGGVAPSPAQDAIIRRGTALVAPQMSSLSEDELTRHLHALRPLHPLTAAALPALFKRIGQQERSLFAFVGSAEPGGLAEFARTSEPGAWYRLHHLYDYLWTNLRSTLLAGPGGKRWAEIEGAVGRNGSSPDELVVLKTIGLLGVLGELSPIRADLATLFFALEDAVAEDPNAVLGRLVERSVVVKRAFSNSFALWEGSDVDIEERLREATFHLAAEPLRALAEYLPARPVVARRHSIETGTLRYFDVAYVSAPDDFTAALSEASDADGLILLYVRHEGLESVAETRALLARLRKTGERPVLLALIEQPTEVREIIAHIEQLEWVRKHTRTLAGDPVARREMEARRRIADDRLRMALGGGRIGDAVHAFASSAAWFDEEGRPVRVPSERSLNELLSAVCTRAYRSTPVITNELVNRRTLSSSAAKAQRILLEKMVTARGLSRLGIEGAPPELSMFYSLLEQPGLYRETGPGSGVLDFTDLRLHPDPAWQALGAKVDALLGEQGTMLSLVRVLEAWRCPPFALKAGVLPVILAQVLLSREDELALYEADMFVPELSVPVLERMAKNPQTFAIRSIPASGLTTALLHELVPLLQQSEIPEPPLAPAAVDACVPGAGRPGLLRVVRPWVQFVATLPDFTKATTQVSAEARGVRDAILRASDPLGMLLEDLPAVLGVDPTLDAPHFAARLGRALRELRTFYDPRILDEIYEGIIRAVGENTADAGARERAAARAGALYDRVTELRLKAFCFRLSEARAPRGAWCESVASMVAQKPPQKWRDDDLKAFHLEVGALGRRMRSAEAAAFASTAAAEPSEQRSSYHVHLAATTATGQEFAEIVRIDGEAVGELSRQLAHWLREHVHDGDLRKAVLAKGWQDIVAEGAAASAHTSHGGD